MKFTLTLAALILGAFAQNGYQVGGTGSVTLPTTPSGSSGSDSTGGAGGAGSGMGNIVIPTFPKADLTKLTGGSTSSQVTTTTITSTINAARQ